MHVSYTTSYTSKLHVKHRQTPSVGWRKRATDTRPAQEERGEGAAHVTAVGRTGRAYGRTDARVAGCPGGTLRLWHPSLYHRTRSKRPRHQLASRRAAVDHRRGRPPALAQANSVGQSCGALRRAGTRGCRARRALNCTVQGRAAGIGGNPVLLSLAKSHPRVALRHSKPLTPCLPHSSRTMIVPRRCSYHSHRKARLGARTTA